MALSRRSTEGGWKAKSIGFWRAYLTTKESPSDISLIPRSPDPAIPVKYRNPTLSAFEIRGTLTTV